jgi:polysaccharide biosynthesis protein PelF
MSDVCLILEGTYPYVAGGVSSCVHQLISNTPHVRYSIFYIGANQKDAKEYKYKIPSNVKLIKELFLYDYSLKGEVQKIDIQDKTDLFETFHFDKSILREEYFKLIYEKFFHPEKRKYDPFKLLESTFAWELVEKSYMNKFPEGNGPSFIDYFYSWRFTHYPLFKILTADLPRASVYHSLSTGYAGLAGVCSRLLYGKPFVLTEHGIYSHEREIDIYQADWIYNTDPDVQARKNISYFKEWWIKIFHFIGKCAYEHADIITTLYDGNKARQIEFGAPSEKIEIIPNGINIQDFKIEHIPRLNGQKTMALIGRVVPIKDIKTFIKAIKYVSNKVENLKVYIMGPKDEDEAYYTECLHLVNFLNLGDIVEFTGRVNIKEFLPKVDLLVLSSISEGQPMVLLEGFAGSIPAVTTDVGSCRQLIFGREDNEKDRNIGAAGDVVPFGHPDLMGKAISKILNNDELREKMSESAYQRVKEFYTEEININNYLNVYNRYLSKSF